MYFEVNKLKMDQGSGQALKKLSKHCQFGFARDETSLILPI